jgi:hypothetical protein
MMSSPFLKGMRRQQSQYCNMQGPKVVIEVRWNSGRRHFDVIHEGTVVQLHEMRSGALASARRIAHELIAAGENVEIIVVESDGSHIKDRL